LLIPFLYRPAFALALLFFEESQALTSVERRIKTMNLYEHYLALLEKLDKAYAAGTITVDEYLNRWNLIYSELPND
jgi:hypothetical protein